MPAVRRLVPGDVITAAYLNNIGFEINNRLLDAPQAIQLGRVDSFAFSSTQPDEVWQEVSRETSIIDVNGVSVSRIDSVQLSRPDGTIVQFRFNNS